MPKAKICIQEACDSFSIIIDNTEYYFSQEDTKEKLVNVFKELGYPNVTYEEIY